MPLISRLFIKNFRNLTEIEIDPDPFLNIIVGENGAGKSSLLEAISTLAHGKSFRTHKYRNLIKEGEPDTLLRGDIKLEDDTELSLGLHRKRNGDLLIKANQQKLKSASVLAKNLPILVMESHSFLLLEGSPKVRRKFFDWLVFHVKHSFSEDWKQVIQCYKQRNSLLRRDKITYSDMEPWDAQISSLSLRIQRGREEVFSVFKEELLAFIDGLVTSGRLPKAVDLILDSGWKGEEGSSYQQQLKAQFAKDQAYGYSTVGPHKSDLVFTVGGKRSVDVLSRGQQKLLITALYVSVARVLKRFTGANAVFAIDDLPSELDARNQGELGQWLRNLGSQTFITGIDEGFVVHLLGQIDKEGEQQESQYKMFHVKHGQIQLD